MCDKTEVSKVMVSDVWAMPEDVGLALEIVSSFGGEYRALAKKILDDCYVCEDVDRLVQLLMSENHDTDIIVGITKVGISKEMQEDVVEYLSKVSSLEIALDMARYFHFSEDFFKETFENALRAGSISDAVLVQEIWSVRLLTRAEVLKCAKRMMFRQYISFWSSDDYHDRVRNEDDRNDFHEKEYVFLLKHYIRQGDYRDASCLARAWRSVLSVEEVDALLFSALKASGNKVGNVLNGVEIIQLGASQESIRDLLILHLLPWAQEIAIEYGMDEVRNLIEKVKSRLEPGMVQMPDICGHVMEMLWKKEYALALEISLLGISTEAAQDMMSTVVKALVGDGEALSIFDEDFTRSFSAAFEKYGLGEESEILLREMLSEIFIPDLIAGEVGILQPRKKCDVN